MALTVMTPMLIKDEDDIHLGAETRSMAISQYHAFFILIIITKLSMHKILYMRRHAEATLHHNTTPPHLILNISIIIIIISYATFFRDKFERVYYRYDFLIAYTLEGACDN